MCVCLFALGLCLFDWVSSCAMAGIRVYVCVFVFVFVIAHVRKYVCVGVIVLVCVRV